MPNNKYPEELLDSLNNDISNAVGETDDIEIDDLDKRFFDTLNDALKNYTSSDLDNDGFLKRLGELELDDKQDKNILKNLLNDVRRDFVEVNTINSTDLLLRRDIYNVCSQFPEMRETVLTTRDAIIECDTVTGRIARTVSFINNNEKSHDVIIDNIEKKYNLQNAIKNFIIPSTLMIGERYVNVVPYSKLFAELERAADNKYTHNQNSVTINSLMGSIGEHSLYSKENVKLMTESLSIDTKTSAIDINNTNIQKNMSPSEETKFTENNISSILKNIDVYPDGSTIIAQELGYDGLKELLEKEIHDNLQYDNISNKQTFFEQKVFGEDNIETDDDKEINYERFKTIKGCYVKYLDGLHVIPIRLDRKIIGYYYVTKQVDSQLNPNQPNGVVDLSFQPYTKDKKLVDSLANLIVRSFNKEMLNKNIQLKSEIAEIIMAHKFTEGKLTFLFIPENEIVRFAVNEDENGKGHSMIEPALFPARLYLLLTMFNMLYVLNNNQVRIHYIKSSGLNKDYASQIQKTIRKFQARNITIDDIYSYSGVLNKIGGIANLMLPAGRGDQKAIETDTIEPATAPINTDFLEQLRRQAISATGNPSLMIINGMDEWDFAKTVEIANTKFLSTVSSYKLDFNDQISNFYKILLKNDSDLDHQVINSLQFKFSSIKQPGLNITSNMINDFNNELEAVSAMYFTKNELEDENGPTPIQLELRKELAKEYLPQLDFEKLDKLTQRVRIQANKRSLETNADNQNLDQNDVDEIENKS